MGVELNEWDGGVHATYLKKAKRDGTSCGASNEPNPCPLSDDLYPYLKGEFGEE